jgi:sodium/hydrogen exchanger 10/11
LQVKFRIPIPYSIFVILCGILWGIGSNYVIWMKHYANVGESFVDHIHRVYLPVLVFSASFCTDVHTFLKSLPQILIISLPSESRLCLTLNEVVFSVAFLHACFCGLLMMVILDLDWSYVDGLMFGILFSTIYPMDLLNYFKQITGTHIKHLTVLLAGEMIISATLVLYVHEALNNNINGWVVHWYQFAMGIVRIVLLGNFSVCSYYCQRLYPGIPLGYIVGFLGVFLMRLVSEEPICLMIITMSMCYLSFALCETIACAGTIGVLFSGMMMGLERMALPSDMEKLLSDIWIVIISTMNGLLFFITGIMIPINLGDRLGIGEYIYALVTYLLSNIGRFLTFLIFSPILKRIGYGFNRPNMVICVWGGLKNPLTLSIVLNVHDLYADDKYKACLFFMHLVIVYILFLIINGSSISFIFKAVGLSELSLAKQSNINNCMKYIYQVRDRTIAVLKMDR